MWVYLVGHQVLRWFCFRIYVPCKFAYFRQKLFLTDNVGKDTFLVSYFHRIKKCRIEKDEKFFRMKFYAKSSHELITSFGTNGTHRHWKSVWCNVTWRAFVQIGDIWHANVSSQNVCFIRKRQKFYGRC